MVQTNRSASTLWFFYVVFLNKTTFFGVFENIIGGFSFLHPKMRYKTIFYTIQTK